MMDKNKLKKTYGFDKGSYKYIAPGAEILKYIGQIVILVDFKKDDEGKWTNTMEKVLIDSIREYDAVTMTYNCIYKTEDKKRHEVRIIPEGFSWGDPEKSGEMKRFMPYSIHCQLVEDEVFFDRLKRMYKSKENMNVNLLKYISDDKNQEEVLKYSHNIGVVINTDEGDICWIRIHKLKLSHKSGKKYYLNFGDDKNNWNLTIESDQKEYEFPEVGKFKIIDLMDIVSGTV